MAKPKKASAQKGKKPAPEAVESSEGVQLLLGNMMGDKDRAYHVKTFLALKAKADKARSDLSEFGKKAKEAGVDMAALKSVLKMEGWDPLDLATHLKWMSTLANDRGLPVQIALFEPKFESAEKQAEKYGYDSGYKGANPLVDMYPEGTPCHEAMMRGWRSGQAQIIEDGQKAK